LENGGVELAFLRESEELHPKFERIYYATDRLCAVLPKAHLLAKEKEIELSQLKDEDLLLLAKGTMQYKLCADSCFDAGFEPNVLFAGHRLSNIADYVTKGTGVALLMRGQTRFIRNPKIVVVDITPPICTAINLCWKKGIELSPAAKHFIRSANLCIDNTVFDATIDLPPADF
jgi:DNA-binding transcriptional LysR family regulator